MPVGAVRALAAGLLSAVPGAGLSLAAGDAPAASQESDRLMGAGDAEAASEGPDWLTAASDAELVLGGAFVSGIELLPALVWHVLGGKD